MEGILDIFKWAKQSKFQVAIATSSDRAILNFVIHKFELGDFIDFGVSGNEVTKGKPNPEIFLKACHHFNATPAHCIVIEDSGHGIKAASSAGMHSIGYLSRNTHGQDFSKADHVVSSFDSEFKKIVSSYKKNQQAPIS